MPTKQCYKSALFYPKKPQIWNFAFLWKNVGFAVRFADSYCIGTVFMFLCKRSASWKELPFPLLPSALPWITFCNMWFLEWGGGSLSCKVLLCATLPFWFVCIQDDLVSSAVVSSDWFFLLWPVLLLRGKDMSAPLSAASTDKYQRINLSLPWEISCWFLWVCSYRFAGSPGQASHSSCCHSCLRKLRVNETAC